jgi:hypothetical protein
VSKAVVENVLNSGHAALLADPEVAGRILANSLCAYISAIFWHR